MDSETSDVDTFDYDGADISSSDASTPTTPITRVQPFNPKYKVKVTEPIKNGDQVNYTVKTTVTGSGKTMSCCRQFEDFEWLHHCLLTQCKSNGLIIPPLPPRPIVEAKGAAQQSLKQLGSNRVVVADQFQKDCRSLERYLQLVISHQVFGTAAPLEDFLLQATAPIRANLKKGILGRISSVVEEARKSNPRDIDDYFQTERDQAMQQADLMQDISNNFNKIIFSEQRVSSDYAQIGTVLTSGGILIDDSNQAASILAKFSEVLDDAKHGCDVNITNDENTLGLHLDLYARYAEALKEMLYRRTCLLCNYQDSNRNLERAKPHQHQQAEEAKIKAEREYDECTVVARKEIETFRRRRVLAFQDALVLYADAKVKTARDTYTLLTRSLTALTQTTL